MTLDSTWYLVVNGWARATPALHGVLSTYALWAGPVLIALLLVVGWLRARIRPDATAQVAVAVLTGVAAVVAVLVNQNVVSTVIGRARPCALMPDAQLLLPCSADYSMPSDHAVVAGALVAGLWILERRLGVVAGVLALLLAFSRVYVGVHYPSDVVVGLLAGAAVAVVVVLALRGPATVLAARLLGTSLRPLVVARRAATTGPEA
jgi:undecaprenyl-diphosphatase